MDNLIQLLLKYYRSIFSSICIAILGLSNSTYAAVSGPSISSDGTYTITWTNTSGSCKSPYYRIKEYLNGSYQRTDYGYSRYGKYYYYSGKSDGTWKYHVFYRPCGTSSGAWLHAGSTEVIVDSYNNPPVITQGTSYSLSVDEDIKKSFTLNVTDQDSSSFSWSIKSQGSKGTASASGSGSSKSVSYTPNADISGSDSFVVQVSDGNKTDSITVNVSIKAVNDAPIIVEGATYALKVNEDSEGGHAFYAIDNDGNSFSWSVSWAGDHGTGSVVSDNAVGRVKYVPDPNYYGDDVFAIRVSDGHKTDFVNVHVTVLPVNDAPVISEGTSKSITVTEDIIKSFTLNATDIDSVTLNWSIKNQGTKGVASTSGSGTTKTINYSPNQNVSGSDSFVVQVSDGDKVDTININVAISSVNDAPIIVEGATYALTVNEDTEGGHAFYAIDNDSNSFSWSVSWAGDHGTGSVVSDNAVGRVKYVPDPNYYGDDVFAIRVSDGNKTDFVNVHVTVLPVNDAPVIAEGANLTMRVGKNTNKTFNLSATDIENNTLTWSIKKQGVRGVAAVSGTGYSKSVTYTANPNESGSDSFIVQVSDGDKTDTIAVNLSINSKVFRFIHSDLLGSPVAETDLNGDVQ